MPLRKIIVAPDSFKETLAAPDVARAIADSIARVSDSIEVIQCPVADGGEGTMTCLVAAMQGEIIETTVHGSTSRLVPSRFGRTSTHGGTIGVIELAQASGLEMTPLAERDPTRTTSFGTGELMLAAIDAGCDDLIICIGGSATVDGGTGIAQACGFRFFDARDREITQHMCGGLLHRIARLDRPERVWPRIRIACDVTNPLCGPNGAPAIYGPQKGATPAQIQLLDEGLTNLARIAGGDPDMPGAGAAGGAGYGLVTFFRAKLERGIDLVLEIVRFREFCKGADLVITGEGRLDAQSLQGKTCMGAAKAAHDLGVPTIAIIGSTGPGAEQCIRPDGLTRYHSLTDHFGRDRAMGDSRACIAELTATIVRDLIVKRRGLAPPCAGGP